MFNLFAFIFAKLSLLPGQIKGDNIDTGSRKDVLIFPYAGSRGEGATSGLGVLTCQQEKTEMKKNNG